MKPGVIGLLLGAALAAAVIAACFVDRPSETFECATNADCAGFSPNRQCHGGYCVVANCPSGCTSCDEGARTCTVACTSSDSCSGNFSCPSGWSCTVTCTGDGACNDVRCVSGARCDITCSGANACDDIDCEDACQCDLTCAAGACSSMSCPTRGNGANRVECTEDGTTDTPCDSTRAASCTSC